MEQLWPKSEVGKEERQQSSERLVLGISAMVLQISTGRLVSGISTMVLRTLLRSVRVHADSSDREEGVLGLIGLWESLGE